MNQNAFDVVKRLYSSSDEWIMIVDEEWNIRWSSRNETISELRERLLMQENSWENTIRPFTHEDILYDCYISSSREDGLHVLRFHPSLQGVSDFAMMTAIIQAMISTCTAIFENLDEMTASDMRPYLNALVGDILRIYRILFLEQENKRCMDGKLKSEVFGLQSVLEPIAVKSRSLMRHFATVHFECVDTPLFAQGDLRSFGCAALSAFLLCFRKPEKTQDICISLQRVEQNAVLEFAVTAQERDRTDLKHTPPDFGNLHAEKLLLKQYCHASGIQTEFSETEDTVSCRMTVPLTERGNVVRLRAESLSGANGYFDPVLVMLARVHFRNYF